MNHPPASSTSSQKILKQARFSGKLNYSNRDIASLPHDLININSLAFGEKFWELVPLQNLDLSHNKLPHLSDHFPEAHQDLRILYLSYNSIEDPHVILAQIPLSVAVLKLDHNRMSGELVMPHAPVSAHHHRNSSTLPPWNETLQHLDLSHNQLTSLHGLQLFSNLQFLDLSSNRFVELPQNLFAEMQKLTHLNLSGNQLKDLPPSLADLHMLVELDVSKNCLSEIYPEQMKNLTRLSVLNARENQIATVEFHENQVELAKIFLAFNALEQFPSNIHQLSALTELELSDNQIKEIPFELTTSKSLRRLNMSNNDLNDLPPQLGTMKQLTVISLLGNPLRRIKRSVLEKGTIQLKEYLQKLIPKSEVSRPEALQDAIDYCIDDARYTGKLVMSKKQLTEFPSVALSFPSLTVLDISGNEIRDLPSEVIVQLEELESLNVSNNRLQVLPPELSSHQTLKELKCARNALKELPLLPSSLEFLDASGNPHLHLPSSLTALVRLREAHFAFNQWEQFPVEIIQQCTHLELLDLDSNLIRVIPAPELLECHKLRYLILSNNSLKQLPPLLGRMTWLERLDLQGNPLKTIRYSIISQGTQAVLKHLQNLLPSGHPESRKTEKAAPAPEPTELDEEISEMERKIEESTYLSSAQEYALKKQLARLKAKRIRLQRAAQAKTG